MSSVAELAGFVEERAAQRPSHESCVRQNPEPAIEGFRNGSQILLDPAEREEFKRRESGLRPARMNEPHVDLTGAEPGDEVLRQYAERRTHRHFLKSAIPMARFSEFIGCLRPATVDGTLKRLYGSAGGTYGVQVYLHVKPGRVEDLPAGIYYYHPAEHRMFLISEAADLDRSAYDPFINRPVFDEAAFSLFLIAQLRAIKPLYGDHSLRLATIEAGLISQLLETSAPRNQIGLCHVGMIDFDRIRHLFGLDDDHVFIHSLSGGSIDKGQPWRNFSLDRAFFSTQGEARACEEGEL
jgi:SagB-type dehydrogenase family enzyme